VQGGGIQDVYVLSHGWNNGVDSARNLYQAMFTLLAGMIPDKLDSSCAVGIIWPSLLFPNDDPATAQPIPSTGQQIAAAIAPAFPAQQQNVATLGQLLDQRPQDPAALEQFHRTPKPPPTSPTSGEAWATTATSSRHRAGFRSRSRRREQSTASSRASSTCSTQTPSSRPISRSSAEPTAISGIRKWSGRWSTPRADTRRRQEFGSGPAPPTSAGPEAEAPVCRFGRAKAATDTSSGQPARGAPGWPDAQASPRRYTLCGLRGLCAQFVIYRMAQ
jgi:hypothetical protein